MLVLFKIPRLNDQKLYPTCENVVYYYRRNGNVLSTILFLAKTSKFGVNDERNIYKIVVIVVATTSDKFNELKVSSVANNGSTKLKQQQHRHQ